MEQFIHAAAATQHIPWNKGKLVGQKAPSEAEGYLGDSCPPPDLKPNPRTCLVQSGDRQQTEILRFSEAARPRCVPRQCRCRARNGHATKDSTASAIRNHSVDTRIIADVDPSGRSSLG